MRTRRRQVGRCGAYLYVEVVYVTYESRVRMREQMTMYESLPGI